ncbi:FAD-binding oxidoreductase [Vibrio metschnikovii]|uniref:FAD-binding oxidoreductase n=1 Tax=Vibrio metschnikovii TaxID=28172 RepID=A0A9X0UPR0_VIBME|nr:FAD-binding oxidoreductase [Vibrio metschnikovii]MBC5853248.1 FAD-binding oxidoreductase [Vibrio metschnikovii]
MIIENFNKTRKLNATHHSPCNLSNEIDLFAPIGNCLSYNESSISENIIKSTNMEKKIVLDIEKLTVKVSSGITIYELINHLRNYGLFPYVVPGTSKITIGGAVSNNVHGKNQLEEGLFCNHVEEIEMIDSYGKVFFINKNNPLFQAVCGGIGTIGFIKSVTLKVRKIPSDFFIVKNNVSNNLEHTFKILNFYKNSVAWIDMSAKKSKLGRGVVISASYSSDNKRSPIKNPPIKITNKMKISIINPITSLIFCKVKYIKEKISSFIFKRDKKQHFSKYLFPLDSIEGWNNLYGVHGFYQFQALIPNENSKDIIEKLILHFQSHYLFSPLVVIKRMKKSDIGYLSFSGDGYSICFDLPIFNPLSSKSTIEAIKDANELTLKSGGLIYLAKDELMDRNTFLSMYKNSIRQKNAISEFNHNKRIFTNQAKRYGL